jgi:hypothetical protein
LFKFILRTITLIIFIVFILIGLAIWKGGAPFRTMGKKIVEAGNVISQFGDFVDDVKRGSKKMEKTYDHLKESVSDNDFIPAKKR